LTVAGQGFEDDAVDDGFEGVVLALLEAHAFFDFGDLAVDADAVALFVEGFDLFAELAFAAADDGSETVMRSCRGCARGDG
jgi:hypothetical protein